MSAGDTLEGKLSLLCDAATSAQVAIALRRPGWNLTSNSGRVPLCSGNRMGRRTLGSLAATVIAEIRSSERGSRDTNGHMDI